MKMTKSRLIRNALAALFFLSLVAGISCMGTRTLPGNVKHFGRAQLADYKGKVVLLDFYATWCDPCRKEAPHLVALHRQYEAKGLQVIGLNVGGEDDHAQVPAFAKEFGIQFPLAIPDGEFVEEYLGMDQRIPQRIVLDRQGKIVKHFVGYSELSSEELDRIIQATLEQTQQ